jgi:hypothetical protein
MLDLKALALPFPPKQISWRVGTLTQDKTRGLALAYLDARDVMARLDDVCGPSGWQATYPHAGQKTVCSIGILCGEHWVWKSNGAGDTDVEQEKGALSDAFKRAAVLWGIGRYLYDVPTIWAKVKQQGRSFVISDDEMDRLADILAKMNGGQKAAPDAYPEDKDVIDGAKRWVSDQTGVLGTLTNRSDVLDWNKRNAKALQKLQRTSEALYDQTMKAYDTAFRRTAMAA